MTTAAGDSREIVFLFRLRDELTSGLQRIEDKLTDVNRTSQRGTQNWAGYSRQLLLLGGTLLMVSGNVARLARNMGLLSDEQAESLDTWLATIGTLAAVAGGIARLIPIIRALAAAERTRAIATAIANVITSPKAIATIALALAAGAVVGASMKQMIESHQMGAGQRHMVPGPSSQGRMAMLHGGETVSRGGGGGAVVNLTINGPMMGNAAEATLFARQIGRLLRDDNRTRGTTL
jgi:hypothetical protein